MSDKSESLKATVWYFEDNENQTLTMKNFEDYRIIDPDILVMWTTDRKQFIFNGDIWTSIFIEPNEKG